VFSCCEIFLIVLTVNGIYSLSLLHCSTVPELAADKEFISWGSWHGRCTYTACFYV